MNLLALWKTNKIRIFFFLFRLRKRNFQILGSILTFLIVFFFRDILAKYIHKLKFNKFSMSLEELDYISVVQIKRKPESLIHIILVPVQYVLLINKIKMKKNIKLGDLLNKETSEHKISLIHFLGPYVLPYTDIFFLFFY